jgi:hypothetical protein
MDGTDQPAGSNLDLGSIFEEKPPPSWGSPEWKWGYADGAAHEVAARVRRELDKPHRRSAFVTYAKCGTADLVDLKMVLALSCQRVDNTGSDEADGRWKTLMDEMAAVNFEHEGLIDIHHLAEAANKRLAAPMSADEVKENPTGAIAAALEQLEFTQKGM